MKKILKKLGGTVLMALLFSLPSQGMENDFYDKKIEEGFSNPPQKVEIDSFFPPEIWIEIIRVLDPNSQLALRKVNKALSSDVALNGALSMPVKKNGTLSIPVKILKEKSDLENILEVFARGETITKLIFSCPFQEKPLGTPLDVVKKLQRKHHPKYPSSFGEDLYDHGEYPLRPSKIDLYLIDNLKELKKRSILKSHASITTLDFSNTFLGRQDVSSLGEYHAFSNLIKGNGKDPLFKHIVSLNFTNASLLDDHIEFLIGSREKIPTLKDLNLRYDNCPSNLEVSNSQIWRNCNLEKLDLTGRKMSAGTGLKLSHAINNNPALKKMTLVLEDIEIPTRMTKKLKEELKEKIPLLTWAKQ